jgi:hypothetical protein
MSLSSADRIAFSSYIVDAASEVAGLNMAQALLQAQIVILQNLDNANEDLFSSINDKVTAYQMETSALTGNAFTTVAEQDVINAAKKIIQNDFFPNDTQVSVPSLAAQNNVYTQVNPYALNFAIGKNYSEAYPATTMEGNLIGVITTLISNTSVYTDMELTTGNSQNGTCSLISYVDQPTCVAASGIWTPGVGNSPNPNIATIESNMTTAVNTLVSFLTTEVSQIVTNDTTAPNQANNAAAVSNINTVILPALNTWLTYPSFEATGSGPSKLHSTQMGALQTALSNRLGFIATRLSQLNVVLGTITQNVVTGAITSSSGLYGQRYNYLNLRINVLTGSLTKLTNAQNAVGAQNTIIPNILSTVSIYQAILPTSALAAAASGTNIINLTVASPFSAGAAAYSPGDQVYVMADNQQELTLAIKSISGNLITLNNIVPAKYTTSNNARIYKDLT